MCIIHGPRSSCVALVLLVILAHSLELQSQNTDQDASTPSMEVANATEETPRLNNSDSLKRFWIKTVVQVPFGVNILQRTFLDEMEQGLASLYETALVRELLLRKGSSFSFKRRKRQTTVERATVQVVAANRTNPDDFQDVDVIHYLVEGPLSTESVITPANRAVFLLSLFDAQEVALALGYPVVNIAEVFEPGSVPADPRYWIIGVVLGSLLFIALVIWGVCFCYLKCTRPPKKRKRKVVSPMNTGSLKSTEIEPVSDQAVQEEIFIVSELQSTQPAKKRPQRKLPHTPDELLHTPYVVANGTENGDIPTVQSKKKRKSRSRAKTKSVPTHDDRSNGISTSHVLRTPRVDLSDVFENPLEVENSLEGKAELERQSNKRHSRRRSRQRQTKRRKKYQVQGADVEADAETSAMFSPHDATYARVRQSDQAQETSLSADHIDKSSTEAETPEDLSPRNGTANQPGHKPLYIKPKSKPRNLSHLYDPHIASLETQQVFQTPPMVVHPMEETYTTEPAPEVAENQMPMDVITAPAHPRSVLQPADYTAITMDSNLIVGPSRRRKLPSIPKTPGRHSPEYHGDTEIPNKVKTRYRQLHEKPEDEQEVVEQAVNSNNLSGALLSSLRQELNGPTHGFSLGPS